MGFFVDDIFDKSWNYDANEEPVRRQLSHVFEEVQETWTIQIPKGLKKKVMANQHRLPYWQRSSFITCNFNLGKSEPPIALTPWALRLVVTMDLGAKKKAAELTLAGKLWIEISVGLHTFCVPFWRKIASSFFGRWKIDPEISGELSVYFSLLQKKWHLLQWSPFHLWDFYVYALLVNSPWIF